MITSQIRDAAAATEHALAPLVHVFRALQDPGGQVAGEQARARALLAELRAALRAAQALLPLSPGFLDAFEQDAERWAARGLDTPPAFDATLAAYAPPSGDGPSFFVAPLIATNGPSPRGRFLECFLTYREEPPELEQIAALLPHPKNKCQSTRLLAGSRGLMQGNCIVFFPENVATAAPVDAQTFALFFFNKFYRIYHSETLPRVRQIFGADGWASARLSPADCYRARCIWGYLHDYYHHCGPRPFDTNLQVKLNFFVGLLEEIKVDCQSALAARRLDLPFQRELVEFIVFERMFRYPAHPDAAKNFDAGTGVLLFQWLLGGGYGLRADGPRLRIDLDGCLEGMARLAERIEALEQIGDNDAYRKAARAFVRTLLDKGAEGARFAMPPAYTRAVPLQGQTEQLLDFADLPY